MLMAESPACVVWRRRLPQRPHIAIRLSALVGDGIYGLPMRSVNNKIYHFAAPQMMPVGKMNVGNVAIRPRNLSKMLLLKGDFDPG